MYYYSEFLYICSVFQSLKHATKIGKRNDKTTAHEKRHRQGDSETARSERAHGKRCHQGKDRHGNGEEDPHDGRSQLRRNRD